MSRSYRDEWVDAGMVEILAALLQMGYNNYTSADILEIAEAYEIDQALVEKMAWHG